MIVELGDSPVELGLWAQVVIRAVVIVVCLFRLFVLLFGLCRGVVRDAEY